MKENIQKKDIQKKDIQKKDIQKKDIQKLPGMMDIKENGISSLVL